MLPAAAKIANIHVPAFGKASTARDNVPGHSKPTPSPQSAHASNASTGLPVSDIKM